MKFWKKLKYWQRGIIIGLIVGLLKLPFFMVFGEYIPPIGYTIFQIPDQQICNMLHFSDGEPCGFFVFFYGWIYNPPFYAIIGAIGGLFIGIIKNHQKVRSK